MNFLSQIYIGKKESVPVMRLEYGTKKSNVPFKNDEPMVILDGEKQSYDQLVC